MFKVLDKLPVGNIDCVSVEGNIALLKNGLKLIDEKGNVFEIATVATTNYHNIEDFKSYAEIVLVGDVKNIGQHLYPY